MHRLKSVVHRKRGIREFCQYTPRLAVDLEFVKERPLTYKICSIDKFMVTKPGVDFFEVLPTDCIFLGPDGEVADLEGDRLAVSYSTFDPVHVLINV